MPSVWEKSSKVNDDGKDTSQECMQTQALYRSQRAGGTEDGALLLDKHHSQQRR